jgi:ribosomal protein L6P/L9E
MKVLLTESKVPVPEGVAVAISHKKVLIAGPRGVLERDFAPAIVEIELVGNSVVVRCWQGDRKQRAMVNTVCGHLKNMINGVIAGYEAEVRSVFTHFPIRLVADADKHGVIVSNFMGKRDPEHFRFPPGVTYEVVMPNEQRLPDSSVLRGTDLEQVTGSAAALRRLKPIDKDPVKFRDGLYRKSLKYIDKEVLEREAPLRSLK